MANKFEMIEPHPLFAKKRLGCYIDSKLTENQKFTFHQVVSVDPENFNLKLSSEATKAFTFDHCQFLSKIFKISYDKLSDSSQSTLYQLMSLAPSSKPLLLVGTLTPSHYRSHLELPLVAILPNKDFVSITLAENADPLEDL